MTEWGEICRISDSHFIWKIPFSHFRSFYEHLCSPEFQYMGETWFLQTEHVNKSGWEFLIFRILCKGTTYPNPLSETYRMCIKDAMGGDYWSSSEETNFFSRQDPTILKSDFLSNACRIAPENVLPFHLTFHEPTEVPTPKKLSIRSREVNSISYRNPDISFSCTCQFCCCVSKDSVELLQDFKNLLLKGRKSDVIFNVKGTEFKAHKAVLTARSPVFGKMFDHDMLEKTSGTVKITDFMPKYFQAFLLYLYTGKVEKPTVKTAVELYCLADKYDISALRSSCVRFLLQNVSVESYCDIVSLGLSHSQPELLLSANAFLTHNMVKIMSTDKWKSFIIKNPADANDLLIEALS